VHSAMAEADIAPASKDPFDIVLPVNYTVASHPPFEEQLLGATLWPEVRTLHPFPIYHSLSRLQIEKLYGHGYEIIALASAHSHPIIATACKATSAEHAVIRLYDSTTWKPTGTILEGHALTITNLRFSPDDRWLLSVSRDRSWHVYEKRDGEFRLTLIGSC
jgi:elongator complex protein 2